MLAPELTDATWRKSSYSGGGSSGGDCVEVADLASFAAVRDSKIPDGSALVFTGRCWNAFIEDVSVDRRS